MLKLQFKDTPERGLWLVGDRIRLGSDKSNDLVLSSPSVKDFHAEISIEPQCVVLISEPGSCFVNNLPVDGEYQLAVDDEIRLGTERLILIDPKQSIKDEDYALLTPPNGFEAAVGWELLPAHANLKDRNFLIKTTAVLGRARDCEFSVPYKLLSRHHARFEIQEGALILEDLASANGSMVNGQRVHRAILKQGDRIAFAKLTFVVKGPAAMEQGDSLLKNTSTKEVWKEAEGKNGAEKVSKSGPQNTEASMLANSEMSTLTATREQNLDNTCSAIDRQLARTLSKGASTENERGSSAVAPPEHQYSFRFYLGACLVSCLLVIAWQVISQ